MHHPTPHAWRGRLRGGWLGIILVPAIAGACSSSGATAPLTASVPPAAAATASIAPSAAASTASAPPAAGGASGSACNLLTASDIQSVTGAASATVIGDKPGLTGDNVCVWQLPGAGNVILDVWTGAAAANNAADWALVQGDAAVSGVGDEARWDANNGKLDVKVGTGYADISVGAADGSADQAAATKLAKLVVLRLGG